VLDLLAAMWITWGQYESNLDELFGKPVSFDRTRVEPRPFEGCLIDPTIGPHRLDLVDVSSFSRTDRFSRYCRPGQEITFSLVGHDVGWLMLDHGLLWLRESGGTDNTNFVLAVRRGAERLQLDSDDCVFLIQQVLGSGWHLSTRFTRPVPGADDHLTIGFENRRDSDSVLYTTFRVPVGERVVWKCYYGVHCCNHCVRCVWSAPGRCELLTPSLNDGLVTEPMER
jgi:hypothetical protein